MKNINQEDWIAQLASDPNAVVFDVRTPEECAGGMLKNAQVLNFFEQEAFIAALKCSDPQKDHYFYCRSGQRSANACRIAEDLGIAQTFNLLGGIVSWKHELVKP